MLSKDTTIRKSSEILIEISYNHVLYADIIGRRFNRQRLARIVNDLINNAGKAEIEHVVRQRARCYERSLAMSSLHVEIE